jgi:hypothetical protein
MRLGSVSRHNSQGIVFDGSRGDIKSDAADASHDAHDRC